MDAMTTAKLDWKIDAQASDYFTYKIGWIFVK
jgi:hypothetical protein